MDYFYKRIYYSLATCKLKSCNATIFPGLEKYADETKDAGQHMAAMCTIKKSEPQLFSNLWNEL